MARKVTYASLRKYIPALPPAQAFQNSAAMASLYGNFQDTMGLLREQAKLLRARTRSDIGTIREQGGDQVQLAAGEANERGILGSSIDVANRANIRTDTARAVQSARNALLEGISQNIGQRMAARREFESGVFQQLALQEAMKSQANIEQMFDRFLSPGPGGGGPGGGNERRQRLMRRLTAQRKDIRGLLQSLEGLDAGSSDAVSSQVTRITDKLYQEWRERNRLRRRLGKKPLPVSRLQALIDDALTGNADTTPRPDEDSAGGPMGP